MSDIQKNFAVIVEAAIGTRDARALHAKSLAYKRTIEAALQIIRTRWPTLKSRSTTEPIFILAAGWRTGSTFLQRLVGSANNVFIWGEPYRHARIVDSLASQLVAFTEEWPRAEFFMGDLNEQSPTQQWVANLYPSMEDFIAGHIALFDRLFAEPALRLGATQWGFKDVTSTVDHACYLRWLFPKAKFIFLYRNPYHAYRSYYNYRDFYRSWPDRPVFTPVRFGNVWRELTVDFLNGYTKVDGLLLRYEELTTPDARERIEHYLGCKVADPGSLRRINAMRGNFPAKWAPKFHYWLLKQKVGSVAADLGYRIA